MKYFFTFLLLCCFLHKANAQNEAANWYFGTGAGVSFLGGVPVALTDGSLSTQEGCATISDFNGNLLFYTDGIRVYNRNHTLMPNGQDLLGNPSSTQSGLIVPHPGNPDLHFIFTVDEEGGPDGLQYNIVDMRLDGGLGDISSKNNPLATEVSEKLTAVTHANGSDFWLLSRSYPGNEFLAYRITATGLDTTPVITAIGIDQPLEPSNGIGSRGQMKVSPDGRYLATVASGTRNTELFRFDASTGLVSNALQLNAFFSALPGTPGRPYGIEFSSDGSKLYVTDRVVFSFNNSESTIYQFDLSNYDQASIIASGIAITPTQSVEIWSLQLAIDGKIYVTQYEQPYLGAINNPNVLGVGSAYTNNAVSLSGRLSRIGLPPFIQSYFIVGLQARNFCLGDATEFSVNTSEPVTSISWDFGDGDTSSIETPNHTYATPGTYTVSVTVSTASETKTESKDITIYTTPVANVTSDFEVCSTSLTYEFDLSTKDVEVLGGQLQADTTIGYYPSFADAQNGTNLLPTSYTNSNPIETIYARISNSNNPSCFDIANFELILKEAPILNPVTDWTVCDTDTDGIFDFDLSQKDVEIRNGQDDSLFFISYHSSQADADTNTDPIGPNYTNTGSPQTIYFRIENMVYPECHETGSFVLEVITGVNATTPSPIQVCDDNNDGLFSFDLTTNNNQILNGQSATSFSVSYHTSLIAAEAGTGPLNAANYTNSTPYSETLYARVANNANPNCFNTAPVTLNVLDSPILQSVTDWEVCDTDNDGISIFDLTEKDTEILGNQNPLNFQITYHTTQNDADLGQNSIVGAYQNVSTPQPIFYRLESSANTLCFVSGSFELQVFDTPSAHTPTPIIACDENETGLWTFDLSAKDFEILNGQDPFAYEVSYFEDMTDAANNQNALSKTAYTNSNLNETLYVRIQNNNSTNCYDLTELELTVNPIPNPELEETYVICPDSPELTIDGGNFESWSWRDATGSEIETDRALTITELGEYDLTVSQTANGLSCEKTIAFEVVSSGAPESIAAEVTGFSDKVSVEITATGIGDFEYSVDGENFQPSNRFEVFPGEYTIYVRDVFLCRTLNTAVFALGYQKFFTPNGDNSNDYWNIIGSDKFPQSQLYIYDRYGKLLSQIAANSQGWDGNYNGRPMPSSDYWFKYFFEDGKVFAGHFALKR